MPNNNPHNNKDTFLNILAQKYRNTDSFVERHMGDRNSMSIDTICRGPDHSMVLDGSGMCVDDNSSVMATILL